MRSPSLGGGRSSTSSPAASGPQPQVSKHLRVLRSGRRRKEIADVTASGRAQVTPPTDEQILITREVDAPKHLV